MLATLKDLWPLARVVLALFVLDVAARFLLPLDTITDFNHLTPLPQLAFLAVLPATGWVVAGRRRRYGLAALPAALLLVHLIFWLSADGRAGQVAGTEVLLAVLGLLRFLAMALIIFHAPRPDARILPPEDFTSEIKPLAGPAAGRIAEALHREAERMKRLSFVTLGGVGALMALAVLVVLFAGFITSIDLTGADRSAAAGALNSKASAEVIQARRAVEAYETQLLRLTDRLRAPEAAAPITLMPGPNPTLGERRSWQLRPTGTGGAAPAERAGALAGPQTTLGRQGALDELDVARETMLLTQDGFTTDVLPRRFDTNHDFRLDADEIARAAAAASRPTRGVPGGIDGPAAGVEPIFPEQRARLQALRDDLSQAEIWEQTTRDTLERAQVEAVSRSGAGAESTEALIASAVTRFGVIAVLMFFAQALINLYRYALRLSAFYRARAVAMVMADGDADRLDAYARVLSADHVTLGREPRTPLAEVRDAARIVKDLRP